MVLVDDWCFDLLGYCAFHEKDNIENCFNKRIYEIVCPSLYSGTDTDEFK